MQNTTTKFSSGTSSRRRKLIFALISLLILVLIGSGAGTLYFFSHQSSVIPASQIVGHAFFKSSGQLDEGSSQGIEDQMQIELNGIPSPATGKSYYAWLLGDVPKTKNVIENKCQPKEELISLGKVTVKQGQVDFSYSNAKHTNLISCTSRLLITEENAASTPLQPSTDKHAWMYYAEIPQLPNPTDRINHYSALDDIRHLLYEGPSLKNQGLHGGLDIQLLRNTQKILEWAGSARDAWHRENTPDINFIHRQVVRILDYLDGTVVPKGKKVPLVQTDVPPGTPILVNAQVPLFNLPNYTNISTYLTRISGQLSGIGTAPDVSPTMRAMAKQINSERIQVKSWLGNVYKDAKALIGLTDEQLRQPSVLPILDDLQVQANNVFVGQQDPSTGQVAAGVVQIHYDIQHMVTFDIRSFATNA